MKCKCNSLGYSRTGPGKFESSGGLGQLLWTASLEDWTDDEVGDVEEDGYWCGRIPLGVGAHVELQQQFPEEYAVLDAEDKADLKRAVGAVVCEDSQGFVEAYLIFNKRDYKTALEER